MKWSRPYIGDTRIIRRFALFPIKTNDEIYWLTWVTICQSWNYVKGKWENDYAI